MNAPDIHRDVLDNLLDGVLVVGSGGRIETLNPAAERILGLEPDHAAAGRDRLWPEGGRNRRAIRRLTGPGPCW